jgi:hypothetical protein
MAVHRAAWANHHVEAAWLTRECASAGRVATAWNRKAANLRAGDLRLRCVTAASGLRNVMLSVMLRSSLSCDGNHENGESEDESFHANLKWVS